MARIDMILQYPESMKKWLSAGEGRIFRAWLEDWATSEEKILHESKDPVEIYRAQGQLEVLGRILGLSGEVDQFLKRKPENKTDGRK